MSLIDKCYYIIRNDTRYTSALYDCILSVDNTDDMNDSIDKHKRWIIISVVALIMYYCILGPCLVLRSGRV